MRLRMWRHAAQFLIGCLLLASPNQSARGAAQHSDTPRAETALAAMLEAVLGDGRAKLTPADRRLALARIRDLGGQLSAQQRLVEHVLSSWSRGRAGVRHLERCPTCLSYFERLAEGLHFDRPALAPSSTTLFTVEDGYFVVDSFGDLHRLQGSEPSDAIHAALIWEDGRYQAIRYSDSAAISAASATPALDRIAASDLAAPASHRFNVLPQPGKAVAGNFFDADGNTLRLSDYAGRCVILHFWASWCAPCITEIPALDARAGDLASTAVVLPVTLDVLAEPALAILERLSVENLGFFQDKAGELFNSLGGTGVPATYLLDDAGRLLASLDGAGDWAGAESRRSLRRLLASCSDE